MAFGFRFKIVLIVIVTLVVVNLAYFSAFMMRADDASQGLSVKLHHKSNKLANHRHRLSSDRITIDFDIMDIYRIDISCDYITNALGSRVNARYANKIDKTCSRSSQSYSSSVEKHPGRVYEPMIDAVSSNASSHVKNFDPFKDELSMKVEEFDKLESGGEWTPSDLQAPCNVNNIDYVVFIIPFTRSRIDNLKLFLINMHKFLQNTPYSFK